MGWAVGLRLVTSWLVTRRGSEAGEALCLCITLPIIRCRHDARRLHRLPRRRLRRLRGRHVHVQGPDRQLGNHHAGTVPTASTPRTRRPRSVQCVSCPAGRQVRPCGTHNLLLHKYTGSAISSDCVDCRLLAGPVHSVVYYSGLIYCLLFY